jgi:hypothetical protein
MPVLADIFSAGNTLKRRFKDFAANPALYTEQMAGIAQEQDRELNTLRDLAFGDPKNPTKVTNSDAFRAYTERAMEGPLSFANMGITKVGGKTVRELLYGDKPVLDVADKRAITKLEKELKIPAVMRREQMRAGGQTIATPTPGLTTISEIAFNPEKLVGKTLVPVFGDTSAIGKDVQQIRGVPLSKPVTQQGGFQYPLVKSNVDEEIAYASEPTAAANKIKNFEKFPDEDVLGVFLAGGPQSIDFSHHQAQGLVRQLGALEPSVKAIKSFDEALRNKSVDKKTPDGKVYKTYPFKNIKASIISPDMEALMTQRTTKDFTPGQLRTAISQLMYKDEFRKQGFPVYKDALEAFVDPRLQQGFMGQTIFEAIPGRGIQTPTYTHQSYSAGIPGRYVGGLQSQSGGLGAPAELLFPQLYAKNRALGKTDAATFSSMLKSHQGEKFTEEALDPLMQFLGYR